MTKKRFHPRRSTGGRLPLPRWSVEIEMSDGSKGKHEGPYADAFAALTVAKLAFPSATRISVKKAYCHA